MFCHQPLNSTGNYSYNMFVYDNVNITPHFHKNFELVYVISGKIYCTTGEKCATLAEGDFALFLSNEVHSIASIDDSKCWIGVFSGDFIHAFEKRARGNTGSHFVFRCEEDVQKFVEGCLLRSHQPSFYLLKACLYAVCNEYTKNIQLLPKTRKSDLMMQEIIDYIAENYNNKISLLDMSERLGYNYHYLSKCFHKIFSVSFTEFLNSYRLDAALTLLRETDKDIAEIALESGFQSIRSFNCIFKNRLGTTPMKYRRWNHQNN